MHAHVLVVGGGSAGISVASRLVRKKVDDVVILDPSKTHLYQPLFTIAGAGRTDIAKASRPMSSVIPKGVRWIQESAASVDPQARTLVTGEGTEITYDALVLAPGIQLNWEEIPGMAQAVRSDYASSNYAFDLAPHTWDLIKNLKSGTALFTQPSNPIKCAGAPQKIAYLAADYWRKQGVLDDIRMIMVLPTPGMFGVPVFSKELEKVVQDYGIEVRFESEVTSIDSEQHTARVTPLGDPDADGEEIVYDFMHAVPRQSAPDWIRQGPLAVPNTPTGYVDVDKNTLQHVRHPEIFAIGDAGSTPNSKTGAAIRKQAPVVAQNVADSLAGRPLSASYNGYASCPLTVSQSKILIAEFNYLNEPEPTLPLINTLKPVKDFGQFKKRMLPTMYWNFMLKGLA